MATITRTPFLQAHRHTPWRSQLQMIGIFSMIVVMVGLISGVYLDVTARAATQGREIQGLQEVIFEANRVNADLESQLGTLTSSTVMAERAAELGFRPVRPEEILYIQVDGYPGRQEAVFAPPNRPVVADDQALPEEYTQSLYAWLKDAVTEKSIPGQLGRAP